MAELERLVKRIREHDEAAFEQLYQATHMAVFAFVFAIVTDRMTAEDVTQETYMKMLGNIDSFDGRSQFKTWLLSIAKNLAIDHYRKNRRTISVDPTENEYLFPVHHDRIEEKLETRDLLNLLDSEERAVVLMKAVQGMKHREIAAVLDKPPGTVMWLYKRAIDKMKRHG